MQSANFNVPSGACSIFHLIIALEFSALSLTLVFPLALFSLPDTLHSIFTLTHLLRFPIPSHVFLKRTVERLRVIIVMEEMREEKRR